MKLYGQLKNAMLELRSTVHLLPMYAGQTWYNLADNLAKYFDGTTVKDMGPVLGGEELPSFIDVTGATIIDPNYTVNKCIITEDTIFSVTPVDAGHSITIVIKNEDTVSHTCTFAGVGIDPLDAIKVVPSETYNIYGMSFDENGPYVCVQGQGIVESFPVETTGDLIVLSGETVTLSAGAIYSYDVIDIQLGGKVIIDDINNEANLTELYGKEITIDGEINGNGLSLIDDITKNITTASDKILSITTTLTMCGGGGNGGRNEAGYGIGGVGTKAHGGGGGGGGYVYLAHGGFGGTNGGDGGYCTNLDSSFYSGSKGVGSVNELNGSYSSQQNGGNGAGSGGGASYSDTSSRNGSGGGGGGRSGGCGLYLFIYSNEAISGSGTINLEGNNGGSGGGSSSVDFYRSTGGGGGGGAGGAGGHLFTEAPSMLVAYNVSGGTGGSGGISGTSGATAEIGTNGGSGANGSNGTYTEL